MASGSIGDYRWAEFTNEAPQLTVPTVVRGLAEHVKGLRGVNVAWDSGRLLPSDSEVEASWVFQDGYAVTPVINAALIQDWPYSGDGYDEWYFFRVVPVGLQLAPYCNWCSVSVGDWEQLTFRMDLGAQLAQFRPELVIGENQKIFVISRDAAVVDAFLRLALNGRGHR